MSDTGGLGKRGFTLSFAFLILAFLVTAIVSGALRPSPYNCDKRLLEEPRVHIDSSSVNQSDFLLELKYVNLGRYYEMAVQGNGTMTYSEHVPEERNHTVVLTQQELGNLSLFLSGQKLNYLRELYFGCREMYDIGVLELHIESQNTSMDVAGEYGSFPDELEALHIYLLNLTNEPGAYGHD